MKATALTLFLLWHLMSFGQVHIEDNCQWNKKFTSVIWYHGGQMSETNINTTYKTLGDTLINNVSFLKLFTNQKPDGYFFIDANKTYFGKHPDSLYLMYNFDLTTGDTFAFRAPSYPGPLLSTVKSVDTISINGLLRKKIQFNKFPNYGLGPLWIEGIGDVQFGGLEFDYSYVIYDMNYSSLKCFLQNNQNLYGDCTLGIQNDKCTTDVYPNPTRDLVRVSLKEFEKPAQIKLLNSKGKVLQEFNCLENDCMLDLTNYSKGIFIIQIWNTKKMLSKKIIKE